MLRTSTTLCTLMGAALLAAGIAFAEAGIAPLAQSQEILKTTLFNDPAAAKGDRLMPAKAAENVVAISIVEIVGITRATIILRGSNGEVLYRSDPRSGITTMAKNTDLPILTMREDLQNPAVQHPPATQREGSDEGARKPKRQTPVGCLGDVSPLASASANRMPSLCLASLGKPLS
ncbi:hypothetical protein AA309_27890 [Microvirga vignae]|uniref:Pilus formation protein N-terminal domain-containing protein n=1 Tax=Microvirga vignae TaxID=1225564 RepID=A0A0H1RBR9_9HYPH|nr:hypothetical protein [Microvirga vignae]KLK90047.1 hypothetical protein AA309_27890 [Microvirga vignae]